MIATDKISVYLVDDVAELRELVRLGLETDPGFEVIGEAGDGRSAVEGVGSAGPAAVLLDLSMPDMDGLEAIPLIRERSPHTAIVVLSGFAADPMSARAIERGADGYIEKGTAVTRIREEIRRAVGSRRSAA